MAVPPFGLLLTQPLCTREDYQNKLVKGLILLCQSNYQHSYLKVQLKGLREPLARQSGCAPPDQSLLERLFTICTDEAVFIEYFLVLSPLLLPNLPSLLMFYQDCLARVLDGDNYCRVFLELDEIFATSPSAQTNFCQSIDLARHKNHFSKIFEAMTKVIAGRLDDDFEGFWSMVKSSVNSMPETATDISVFLDFARALTKLSYNEEVTDLIMTLIDSLFSSWLKLDDPNYKIVTSFSTLLSTVLEFTTDPESKSWILTGLDSNIRRLCPARPKNVSAGLTSAEVNFYLNIIHFFTFSPDSPNASSIFFMKNAIQIEQLSKNEQICQEYIQAAFHPRNLPSLKQGLKCILEEILSFCEGSFDSTGFTYYNQLLSCFLIQLSLTPSIDLFGLLVLTGFSSKKDFRVCVRYQIASLLLQLLNKTPCAMELVQALDRQLYPVICSLLHARFQEGLPFEFSCFVQEHYNLVLDLVARASFEIVSSGLKPWTHFLAIMSPIAPWIAYGKQKEHRRLCWEIYSRWQSLSSNSFSQRYPEYYFTALLHVLLDSDPISEADSLFGMILKSGVSIKGALQFVPLSVEESADWPSYSHILLAQLLQLQHHSNIAPGKNSYESIYEKILAKEEKYRQQNSFLTHSSPLFLANLLARTSSSGRMFLSATFQLISSLPSSDENEYYQVIRLCCQSERLRSLCIQVLAENIEFIDMASTKFIRFTYECIRTAAEEALAPLFLREPAVTEKMFYKHVIFALQRTGKHVSNLSKWIEWVGIKKDSSAGFSKSTSVDFGCFSVNNCIDGKPHTGLLPQI